MTEACGIDYPSDYRLSCWWCDTFFPHSSFLRDESAALWKISMTSAAVLTV